MENTDDSKVNGSIIKHKSLSFGIEAPLCKQLS